MPRSSTDAMNAVAGVIRVLVRSLTTETSASSLGRAPCNSSGRSIHRDRVTVIERIITTPPIVPLTMGKTVIATMENGGHVGFPETTSSSVVMAGTASNTAPSTASLSADE